MNYKQGYKGDDLKQYQTKLGITADGIFGKQTDQAVRDFQSKNNLTVDGIIGKNTIGAFSGLGQKESNSIDVTNLGQHPNVTGIPVATPSVNKAPDFTNLLSQAQNFYKEDDKVVAERQRQQSIVSALQGQGGRADLRNQLSDDTGLETKRIAMQNASNKLTQLQAEEDTLFDRINNDTRGRGITREGLSPIRQAQQTDLAVKKRYAAADLLAAQGDYNGARDQINQAVEDIFADRQDKLTASREQLKWLNEEAIRTTGRQDKELNLAFKMLDREEKKLEEEKAERKTISNIMLEASKNGANQQILERIKQSNNLEDAIKAAGTSLQDPMVELQKQKMRQDMSIARERMNFDKSKYNFDLAIAREKKAGEKATQKIKDDAANAKLDMQLSAINDIVNSKMTGFVVGTNPFARTFEAGTMGLGVAMAGGTDDVRTQLSSILSKDVLNDFINAKAEGAVFGSLSNEELNLLRQSANAISPAVYHDDNGRVDYIDMSEQAFYKELNNMAMILQRAKMKNDINALPKELIEEAIAIYNQ